MWVLERPNTEADIYEIKPKGGNGLTIGEHTSIHKERTQ